MKANRLFFGVLLGILMISIVMTPSAMAATETNSKPGAQQFQAFDIDSFTYRVSFQLADGTEIFLLRCSFKIVYFYQHHHPTISEHYFQSYVGFYFGKSALGRSLVSSVSATNLAFYPKWVDSAGYPHDLLGDEPSFAMNGIIVDGQLTGGFQLIDPIASSRYIPEFGGTFTFEGLVITLVNGVEIDLSDDDIQIILEKELNYYELNEPQVSSSENITFENTEGYTYLTIDEPTPLLHILDLALFIALIGLSITGVTVLVLWIKGKITLPLLRRIPSDSPPQ